MRTWSISRSSRSTMTWSTTVDPIEDAEPEGEEHRDERDDVEAEVDHRWREPRGSRYRGGCRRQNQPVIGVPDVRSNQSRKPSRNTCNECDAELIATIASSGRADEQQHVAAPDPALVETAHTLGVDQHGPEPQPREERRRHPAPALVEELDHRRVRTDRDDQLGAGFVREQHRRVLARALGDERPGTRRPPLGRAARAPGREPVGVHVVRSSSAPQCSAASDNESKSPMMMSGVRPDSISASAPPSTAISTGRYSRMYGRNALRSWL